MVDYIDSILSILKDTFQIAGVIFITYTSVYAIKAYVTSLLKGGSDHMRYYVLKFDLGRGMVAGLELIVVGDIISTIGEGNQNLFRLTLLVMLRIIIDFFLQKDLQSIPEKDR